MTPAPYEQFEQQAEAAARARYGKAQVPMFVVGVGAGALIGALVAKNEKVGSGLAGAAIGALLGIGLYFLLVTIKKQADAAANYTAAWCAEHGWHVLGDGHEVHNGPHASKGHNPKWRDALAGNVDGIDVLLYNFSYYTTESTGKSSHEEEHPFRILRLTGPPLPVQTLSFTHRGMLGKIGLFDSLDSTFTQQRVIDLESVDFNEKFKLEVHDTADEIWIRRVFDPQTIDALVRGDLRFPNIHYWDGCFWLWESDHYEARQLDEMLVWELWGAEAIQHLARVPSL
jgi:hypothetical protein